MLKNRWLEKALFFPRWLKNTQAISARGRADVKLSTCTALPRVRLRGARRRRTEARLERSVNELPVGRVADRPET